MARRIELWPSLAEFSVYDETVYQMLAGDLIRNDAYRRALGKVLHDRTVVEIGPGSELVLSQLCLEAGARRVYAIEILESTYRLARQRVAELGLDDRIVLIHGDATQVTLPEAVDYCVSEIVGPIGGVEGSAAIINSARRFLKNPAHMRPTRTLTQVAAVHVPADLARAGFSPIGRHYAEKTFAQLGRPFDIRICVKGAGREDLLSTPATFEDLDYTQPLSLDAQHRVRLDFTRAGAFTGWLSWLELFVDDDERVDVMDDQASWLPLYLPLSLEGIPVGPRDYFEGVVCRTLSRNGINPDYRIDGVLHRAGQAPLPLNAWAPHFETRFKANPFHAALFADDPRPATVPGPPSLAGGIDVALPDTPITRLFEAQVERTPDAVGLVHGAADGPRARWTYRAINERANQIAHALRDAGVGPDVPVAVFLDRSPETVVALLAIFKAGGVYVPLDPAYPADHLRYVLEDARVRVVLTREHLRADVPETAVTIIAVDSDVVIWSAWRGNLLTAPAIDDRALILYTSGTTGRPKGVASGHRQMLNRFHWLWKSYPFRHGECVGERTPSTFIPSLWGMLGGLVRGVPTVMLPNDVVRDPARLVRVLAEESVTRVALVPVLLRAVLDAEPDLPARLPHLRLWFTAGEVLTPELLVRFRAAYPEAVLSNDYGSTEVSGVLAFDSRWSDEAFTRVPLGRPIDNCRIHILRDDLTPAAPGEIGELHVAGAPVSLGYLNQPELTAEKFIPDPFSDEPGGRLYRMGDLALRRPDGLIELHGRRDHQVKIRGIRVELAGVEAVLARHPFVRENAVAVSRGSDGGTELVAFVVPRDGRADIADPLLDFARASLPDAAVPSQVRIVDALPRTPNGKVDRVALGRLVAEPPTAPALTPVDARQPLREMVGAVLGRAPLAAADDDRSFPRLGVHSVAMVELARRVSAWLGRDVSVTEIFDHFTIATLSAHLQHRYGASAPAPAEAATPALPADDGDAIAIIGFAGRFPGAEDADRYWANLVAGLSAITEVPPSRWDAARYYDPDPQADGRTVGKWGGFLADIDRFDAPFFQCTPREAKWMDPQQRLFLETSWHALEHAGYADRDVSGRSVGVFVGVRPSDYLSPRHGALPTDAMTLLGNDSAILAGRLSHFLNLTGPSLSIDTSCSSSLAAIHLACRSIRDGDCEMALAGGVSVVTSPDLFVQATKAGMLSPTGQCRTFDRGADGFAPGEGLGVVVLKRLADARRDGDAISAVIRASGLNQDGHTGGLTVPNTRSQSALETAVYREAGIDPGTISYVEAHGTGTPLGDPIEIAALTRAFREHTDRTGFCRIGSAKEHIGHLAAAAGVAGVIKVLLALEHQTIPPNAHADQVNPAIDLANSPFVLSDRPQPWTTGAHRRRAAVSAFGFSGTNAHLVLEDGPEPALATPSEGPCLCVLSAKTDRALAQRRADLRQWLDQAGRHASLADVSYTLAARRSHFSRRAWFVAASIDDLRRQLDGAPATATGTLADLGARYASGADVDWRALFAGATRRVLRLPGYPFEPHRYWHTAASAAETTMPPLFRPIWTAVPARADGVPASSRAWLVSGPAVSEWATAMAATLRLAHATAALPELADIIYVVDDAPGALTRLFRLTRSLDAARRLTLVVVTRGVFADRAPEAAALWGFCRSLAAERPAWLVRTVDADDAAAVLRAPDGQVAAHDGVFSAPRLEPIVLDAPASPVFRTGGVYLIAGGGGGIGFALAEHLARRYQARCVLLGRRALTPDRLADIDRVGACYLQADVADETQVRSAVRQARERFGAIHGVVHAALELNDAPLSDMDEATFAAGLRAKVTGTAILHDAVAQLPLDFCVCFSSVQSLSGNAGQANYAAASAYQDAWARGANRTSPFPVSVINWGYWNEVGAVAGGRFERLLKSQGVEPISVAEGLAALERILGARAQQTVVVRGDARFLEHIGVGAAPVAPIARPAGAAAVDAWVASRLHAALVALGVFVEVGERRTVAGLRAALSVADQHRHAFDAMLQLLVREGVLGHDRDALVVRQRVADVPAPVRSPRTVLVEACLAHFGDLLRGAISPVDVLFPGGSTHLVEPLYTGTPETGIVRDAVQRLVAAADRPVRILELGAGTCGTSRAVIEALRPLSGRVRYTCSDVSPALMRQARAMFAADAFVDCVTLDAERGPAEQGQAPHNVDIVIAANVLHATRDPRQALRHVREWLTDGGSAILLEQTTLEAFLIVTFGWLEGWWRFAEGPTEAGRLPGGPLFSVAGWRSLMAEAGLTPSDPVPSDDRTLSDRPQHVLIARAAPRGDARERVIAVVQTVLDLPDAGFELDRPFAEYGVDSILAQTVVNTLNRELGCRVKAADLYNYPTLRALAAFVGDRIGAAEPTPGQVSAPVVERSDRRDEHHIDERHVAIIGMSGRFPGADSVDAFWTNLAAGRSSVQVVPGDRWNADAYFDADYTRPGKTNSRWGGFLSSIDRFDPQFFRILPREAEWMDPQQRLFLEEAWRAFEDAGYPDRALNGAACGVFVGCKEGDYSQLFPEREANAYCAVGTNSAILAGRVSYALNLTGPSVAVDTACSSSLVAIHLACERLRAHPDEMALAGGVSVMATPHTHLLLGKSGMLSPEGRSKAFDATADGFVPGEAVGAVLLKPLRAALRDGDPIRAVIVGGDVNQDGRTSGITAPSALSQAALERAVYAAAGIDPATIGYVEAHGTGTKLGDPIEITALNAALGAGDPVRIGSVKSNIGHTLAAAGMASIAKVVGCLEHRMFVPTLHLDRISPELDLVDSRLQFSTDTRDWVSAGDQPRRAAVSAFGFSGTNAHLVLQEAPARPAATRARAAWLVPISAKTPGALERRIDDLSDWLSGNEARLEDLGFTMVRGRSHFPVRAAVIARSVEELRDRLSALRAGQSVAGVFAPRVTAPARPSLQQWGAQLLDEIGRGGLSDDVLYERLLAAADLYVDGYVLEWDRIAPEGSGRRISLPTYAFERERCWVPSPASTPARRAVSRVSSLLAADWQPCAAEPAAPLSSSGKIVVLGGERTRALVERIFGAGRTIVLASPAEALAHGIDAHVVGGLDLTAFDAGASWDAAVWQWLQRAIEARRRVGLRLLKVCARQDPFRCDDVDGNVAVLSGLYRMLGAEYATVDSRVLDTDRSLDDIDGLAAEVLAEWSSRAPAFGAVCYRRGARFEPVLRALPDVDRRWTVPPDQAVVITGGTRGVGAAIARHLVERGVRRLALLGRQALPDRAGWATVPLDSEAGRKISLVRALEAAGAEVELWAGSLSARPALDALRARLEARWGAIGGVIHCAGDARMEHPAFVRKSLDDLAAVCEPKIDAVRCLDAAFDGQRLPFFVLCSSVAAAVPRLGAGQADYATANAWMDAYARVRVAQGARGFRSLQWSTWSGVGMGAAPTSAAFDATGLLAHTLSEGLDLFDRAMAVEGHPVLLPCVHRGALDWHTPAGPPMVASPAVKEASPLASDDRTNSCAEWVVALFSEELKIDRARLNRDESFADLGVDSILSAELVKSIGRRLDVSLAPSLLFEHTTLAALIRYIDATFPAAGVRVSSTEPRAAAATRQAAVRVSADTDEAMAVIGVSCRFPGAPDTDAFWRLLMERRAAIGPLPAGRWTPADRRASFGGWLDDVDTFDAAFFGLAEADARVMDPQARLMLEESVRALYDAGYAARDVDGAAIGVYVGGRGRAMPDAAQLASALNPILGAGQNYLAANISRWLNLRGPSVVIDTACSSALVAMQLAMRAMQHGEIESAIVGGVNLLLDDTAHQLFAARDLLCADGRFHIFDQRANGVVLGEGAGAVWLKPLRAAMAAGDSILAVVSGIAVNNNGRTVGPNAPNLAAQREVVAAALASSGRTAADVVAVEANGAGSEVNDLLELKALAAVLGAEAGSLTHCHIGSVKPTVGHLLSAAGLASFIKAVLTVEHGTHPPFLSAEEPLVHFDAARAGFVFDRVSSPLGTADQARAVCVTSFPDGGTNCCVIVEPSSPQIAGGRPSLPAPAFCRHRLTTESVGVVDAGDFWVLTS